MRRIILSAALLAACGDAKPKADTTTLLPAPDTLKPAFASAPDTVKPDPTPSRPATKTKTRPTKAGAIVGRDSAIVMDPNRPRTIKPDPVKPAVVGRDSAIRMDPNRPRTLNPSAPKKDSLSPPARSS